MRVWLAVCFFLVGGSFPAGVLAVTIDWVPVGNAGNAADPYTGSGAVAYNYDIAKYAVTVGQYTEFLNAVAKTDTYGLYYTQMGTDLNIAGIARSGSSGSYSYSVIGSSANLPIAYVNWGDAARFANWLQNGQPTGMEGPGTTETGAYTLNGATTNASLLTVTRNPGATIVIPTEDEWYKATYYNPATSSYYRYPFSSNTRPTSAPPGNTPNTGNFEDDSFRNALTGSKNHSTTLNYLTPVGAYTASGSPYGVYDTGDDVAAWSESVLSAYSYRGLIGGYWSDNMFAEASDRLWDYPTIEQSAIGLRVAMVPEPGSLALASLALVGLAALRRRSCAAQDSPGSLC